MKTFQKLRFNGIFTVLMLILFIASCADNSDSISQLKALKKQRREYEQKLDNIDAQIAELEKEISRDGGTVNVEVKPQPVMTETIEPVMFKHYIDIQGTVESDMNIFVPAESPGIVKRIFVEEGEYVEAGEVMAEIDASIIEAAIDEINVGLDLAKTVYEKQKRLWDQKIGSEIQYLQAKTNLESLEKRLVTTLEQYEKTKIKSPIDGVVDEIVIKEGEAAAAGFGAIRVVQTSDLFIKAQVSEKYINNIKPGDSVLVSFPATGTTFNSTIRTVSRVINPDTRTFTIEVKVPSSGKNILNNMMAVMKINDYTNPNALTVPVNVVQTTGTEDFLFVAIKEGDKWIAKKKFVHKGIYFNDRLEILENIQQGERVIIAGYQDLADGRELILPE